VKEINEFNAIMTSQALLITMYQLFPSLCYLPTQFSREIKRAQQIREKIFPLEYRAHQESYIAAPYEISQIALSVHTKKSSSKRLGNSIPGLMLNVVAVGSETSSAWLTCFFLYNVLYPNVQSKIHEELDAVVGRDRLPNWKDAEILPYLQATLCEVERASGMVTLFGTNAIRDTNIAGYHIPKGTFVSLNLPKVHTDKREWPLNLKDSG
jgi:hypothetical protein